ncbi:MAG: DinB family protein [Acidobacteria bacterium]|nr:DinB family protein [Acidobacteriota bacterium]
MTIHRPDVSEYPTSHAVYVNEAPEGDILESLRRQGEEVRSMLAALPESIGGHRYAPGKWSVRELIGHLNDAEKCFEHRAFRFGRGDASPLPGFDEDAYVAASRYDLRTLSDLAAEFTTLRAATLFTLQDLPPEAWDRRGIANGKEVSVRALAFVITGHAAHHLKVLRERYLG